MNISIWDGVAIDEFRHLDEVEQEKLILKFLLGEVSDHLDNVYVEMNEYKSYMYSRAYEYLNNKLKEEV